MYLFYRGTHEPLLGSCLYILASSRVGALRRYYNVSVSLLSIGYRACGCTSESVANQAVRSSDDHPS